MALANENIDVYFTTNLSKLFVYVYKDYLVDILRKHINIYSSKNKRVYFSDIMLGKLLKLKEELDNQNITHNLNDVLNKISIVLKEFENRIEQQYSYLYSHQRNILPKLLTFHSYGMFWDMGTGKTLTSLIYMKEASKLGLKFIIFVPDEVLMKQWIYESLKWKIFDQYEWNVIRGDKSTRKFKWSNFKHYKYNITTIHSFIKDVNFVVGDIANRNYNGIIPLSDDLKYNFVILLDEASFLKNSTTQRYRSIFALRMFAKGLIALTGTPYENSLQDTFNICRLVKPTFMNHRDFAKKHIYQCGYSKTYVNIDGFLKGISDFSEIVKKSDVVELPDINEYWISVNTLKKDTDEFLNELSQLYSERSMSVLGYISLLKMLDSDYDNYKISSSEVIQGFDFEKYYPSQEKIKWLVEFLRGVNEKVLIVTYYLGSFEKLKKLLLKLKEYDEMNIDDVFLLESNKNKFNIISKFRKSEGKTILLATSTIDYGVDLPNVNYLVNFDIHYNPAKLKQRRDRVYRIGTKDKTFIYYLYGDLIENRIYEIVVKKKEVMQYLEGSEYLSGRKIENIISEFQKSIADEYNLDFRKKKKVNNESGNIQT